MKHWTLPLFPLKTVLFPGMTLPLHVFEPRYLQMVDDCLEGRFSSGDALVGIVLIKEGQEVGGAAVPYEVGTMARIVAVERKEQGVLDITTVGEERFLVHSVSHARAYLVGDVEPFPLADRDAPQIDSLFDMGLALLTAYLELLSQTHKVDIRLLRAPDTPEALAHLVAALLQVPLQVKQQLLSIAGLVTLLQREMVLLQGEVSALTVMLRGQEIVSGEDLSRLSIN